MKALVWTLVLFTCFETRGAGADDLKASTILASNLVFSVLGEVSSNSLMTTDIKTRFQSDELIYRSFMQPETNRFSMRLLPANDAFSIELHDAEGKKITKTAKGKAMGKPIPAEITKSLFLSSKINTGRQDLRALFKPEEVFVITNTGMFTLAIRARILLPASNGVPLIAAITNSLMLATSPPESFKVIEMDPVVVEVIK
jgi:hypothetical protein